MQERGMGGVDADFERLQPIAIDVAFERKNVALGRHKAVDLRKGRWLALAEISPENSAFLHDRISALLDALAQLRIFRLGRRLKTLAGGVEQPAVKGAAQAAIFQPPECEVGAAMRAMTLDQAITSVLVAKQHQVLTEQFDRAHRTRALQLIDQRRRLPVHPHQPSARVFCAGTGDQVVLFLAHHGEVSFSDLATQYSS
jgi:hypothetical protein